MADGYIGIGSIGPGTPSPHGRIVGVPSALDKAAKYAPALGAVARHLSPAKDFNDQPAEHVVGSFGGRLALYRPGRASPASSTAP